jgi:hypothetical protein
MQRRGFRTGSWSWIALPLILVGCEGGDPTGTGSLSALEAEALFQEVADDATLRLPSATLLLHKVREALRAGTSLDAGIHALLDEHEAVRRLAHESREEGDSEGARLLAEQARLLQFEIVVAVLGLEVVEKTVSSVERGHALMRERIEGKWIPRPLMARLESVASVIANARVAIASGDPATALALALRAAEGLRSLSPQAFSVRAEAAIVRADASIEAAHIAVGEGGADPRAAEALERAALFLDRAHWSLENGAFAAALELAITSHQLSSRAVQLNRRGVDLVS